MSLKVIENQTFRRTVAVRVPADGGYEDQSVDVVYNVLPSDETDGFELDTEKGMLAFLERAVATFEDLVDDNGKPLACDEELRQKLIRVPYVRAAVFLEYFSQVAGAAEGN